MKTLCQPVKSKILNSRTFRGHRVSWMKSNRLWCSTRSSGRFELILEIWNEEMERRFASPLVVWLASLTMQIKLLLDRSRTVQTESPIFICTFNCSSCSGAAGRPGFSRRGPWSVRSDKRKVPRKVLRVVVSFVFFSFKLALDRMENFKDRKTFGSGSGRNSYLRKPPNERRWEIG